MPKHNKNGRKSDPDFNIQFDQANRDFLKDIAIFQSNIVISVCAFLVSIIAIIFSIAKVNTTSVTLAVVLCSLMLIFVFSQLPSIRRSFNNSKEINLQLEKDLLRKHPEYKKRLH